MRHRGSPGPPQPAPMLARRTRRRSSSISPPSTSVTSAAPSASTSSRSARPSCSLASRSTESRTASLASAPAVYRLRARNTAPRSENRTHDDAVARRYGFGGGLVPGVTVYAYLTRPAVEAWGPAWLERGTMDVRFLAPFYDGDEVVIDGSPAPEAGAGEGAARHAVELRATNGEGRLCATAGARLPEAQSDAPDPREWPVVPLPEPDQPRHASPDGLQGTG